MMVQSEAEKREAGAAVEPGSGGPVVMSWDDLCDLGCGHPGVRHAAASPPAQAGATPSGQDAQPVAVRLTAEEIVSVRLIPWEPGQQGVEITLTRGRHILLPLSRDKSEWPLNPA